MNQTIDDLLTRYYAGETTLAEEEQLGQFFQQEPLPAQWQQHAALFRYAAQARQQQPSTTFSHQLADRLTASKPVRILHLSNTWAGRIAASVLLVLLGALRVGWCMNTSTPPVA